MYTRYVPQPDGSFHRRHIPDTSSQSTPPDHQEKPREPDCAEKPQEPCSRQAEPRPRHPGGEDGFLRRLLPKDFDSSDLIIILLLLLMAGDSQEDRNTALLTMALYLFL